MSVLHRDFASVSTAARAASAPVDAVQARLDHGAIGNGRLIALVAPTTAVEWLCLPRFDSPSVYAALLDPERGGRFQFLAGREAVRGRSSSLSNTNVLRTEIDAGDARWEVLDFAPRIPH